MKEIIFYLCGIFSCMIVWFLWAIIASKKAKEVPLKEYARIHIDIEKAIRENEEQIAIAKKYQLIEDQVIDQMILQWKIEYLQSQKEWLFTLLGGKTEDSMYSKCQKCGKKLTDPESIERGYGPECWDSIVAHCSNNQAETEECIPGQMTIEDFLGGLKDGEKDMS